MSRPEWETAAAAVPPVAADTGTRTWVHVALLLTTLVTTTIAGALWDGVNPLAAPTAVLRGLPFSLTLLAILLCHESGHYLMCLRHGVRATLPYFLPAPPLLVPIGTFGAFIRIKSRFPDRRALFDIGAGGPWAGFVVALVAIVVGLRLSTVMPASPPGGAMLELGDSLLTGWLTTLVLHADPDTVVLHPIAFAGWLGLFVTSLNLLPVGQLDGGHVVYALAGRPLRFVPALMVAILVWLGLHGWPGWILWTGILLIMTRLGHPPTDVDELPLDPKRRLAAGLSLALFVLTFVAEPFRVTGGGFGP